MMTGTYKPFDYDIGIYAEDNPWFGKKCHIVDETAGMYKIAFYANGKRYTDFYFVEKEEVELGKNEERRRAGQNLPLHR